MSRRSTPASYHQDWDYLMRSSCHQRENTLGQLLRSAMLDTALTGWASLALFNVMGSREVLSSGLGSVSLYLRATDQGTI